MTVDPSRFSLAVRAELDRLEWSPDRSVSIVEWVAELGAQGYELTSVASEALTSFGGLSMGPVETMGPNFTNDEPLTVDPIAAGSGHRELALELEAALGGDWYPVGEWLSYSSVFVDGSGWFVATGLGWIWELGHSIEEAVEFALAANHPLKCLKVLTDGVEPWPKPA